MKKVYYKKSMLQMGDLLNEYDIDIKKDFSKRKRERIRKKVRKYLIKFPDKELKINLRKIILVLDSVDEAGHFYGYI